jgi:uncharacterized membrane protein
MSNKRVAIVVVVVVVLVAVCIMAVGPALMDAIRGIHVIPQH